jgi:hypothetical protein
MEARPPDGFSMDLLRTAMNRIEHNLEAMYPHTPISTIADVSLNHSLELYFQMIVLL